MAGRGRGPQAPGDRGGPADPAPAEAKPAADATGAAMAGFADPLGTWRDWFVKSEREWSEALTGLMQDDRVAQTVGREMNASLYAQQMLKQGMAGSLAAMNLPTQEQLAALGERLGQIDDAIARVEADLTRLRRALEAGTTPAPRRDRRPAGSEAPAAPAPVPRAAAAARRPARSGRR